MMNRARCTHGFTLIELLLTVTIVGIVAATAVPALGKAKAASTEAATIGALRAINGAQAAYSNSCSSGFYAPSIVSLTATTGGKKPFLGAEFAAGDTVTRQGFTIRFTSGPATAGSKVSCTGVAAGQGTQTYFVSADPSQAGNGYSTQHFATISSASVFTSTAKISVFYTGTPPAPATPLK